MKLRINELVGHKFFALFWILLGHRIVCVREKLREKKELVKKEVGLLAKLRFWLRYAEPKGQECSVSCAEFLQNMAAH